MKKRLFILGALLIALLVGLLVMVFTSPENMREISYEGTELTVILGSNKSTGYEWKAEIDGNCIRPSINRSFKITRFTETAGESSIGFEGLSEGSATIVFTTATGWDGKGEGDSYIVEVSVGADGTILSAEEAGG